MANQQGQAFEDLRNTISECLRIVRHRWRISTVGLSIVGSVAFWCSQYLPREYSASTMFERRDDVVLQNLIQSNSPYGFDHLKTTMAMDMTGSRAQARALVQAGIVPGDSFGEETIALSDRERALLDRTLGQYKLQADLRLIHSSQNLDTILLRCSANDPVVARQLVVALRDGYISETRERIREILSGTKEFFQEEVSRLQSQLADGEADLRRRLDEFNGVDPTDIVGVGNRLEMLRAQRDSLFQRQAELGAEVAAREDFLKSPPPDMYIEIEEVAPGLDPNNPQVVLTAPAPDDAVLAAAIDQVQREIVDAITSQRMTVEHPRVKTLYARLAALEELRTTLASNVPEPDVLPPVAQMTPPPPPKVSERYHDWQNQSARVQLELDALQRQLAVASDQLAGAEQRLTRFEDLYNRLLEGNSGVQALISRRSEISAELAVWQGHLARLDRVLAAESGERGTQFTLIEEPQDVSQPTKPRIASVFAVCSGLGLAAAALLVALAELFDRSFRSVGQVTRVLGIPVLECIGVVPTPREKRKAMVSRLVWTPALGLLLCALVVSAALAYASVRMPNLHQRTMQRFDGILQMVGMTAQMPPGPLSE